LNKIVFQLEDCVLYIYMYAYRIGVTVIHL